MVCYWTLNENSARINDTTEPPYFYQLRIHFELSHLFGFILLFTQENNQNGCLSQQRTYNCAANRLSISDYHTGESSDSRDSHDASRPTSWMDDRYAWMLWWYDHLSVYHFRAMLPLHAGKWNEWILLCANVYPKCWHFYACSRPFTPQHQWQSDEWLCGHDLLWVLCYMSAWPRSTDDQEWACHPINDHCDVTITSWAVQLIRINWKLFSDKYNISFFGLNHTIQILFGNLN